MKKVILGLITVLVMTLSGCSFKPEELDYSDFSTHLITSYDEAENETSNKYIVYYYHDNCAGCETIKQDILSFFEIFETLPFYILNIQDAEDLSGLEEFEGTPTVFVMSDNQVTETYLGSLEISNFISAYRNI